MNTLSDTSFNVTQYEITPEQKAHYDSEGYVFLPKLISPEKAEILRQEVMDIMDKIGLEPTKLKQTHQYLYGSPIDHFVHSEVLRNIASTLTGGPSTFYMPFTAVKTANGGGHFHFHQDNQYTRHDGPSINLWTALTSMTSANGCLQIVPRSHLNGTLESVASGDGDTHRKINFETEDFVEILMEPGDCVAFTRLTIHGSGPNLTNEHRVAYAIQYHRDDVNYLKGDQWISLKKHPLFTDIHGCDEIVPPKGKRDGH